VAKTRTIRLFSATKKLFPALSKIGTRHALSDWKAIFLFFRDGAWHHAMQGDGIQAHLFLLFSISAFM
jgi:hypothetical protein